MNYKGKREIKVEDATEAFYARALGAILDDLQLDFELAELSYADEEEMDVIIDGEEWVICYDQDEEGFHFHLVTPEEFEDNYYEYAEYDDDEEEFDDFDFEDEDWASESEDAEKEYEGSREIQASDDISIFHIVTLASVLDNSEVDFETATIEEADAKQMIVDIDGDRVILCEQKEEGSRFLALLDSEEEKDPEDTIIPFKRK